MIIHIESDLGEGAATALRQQVEAEVGPATELRTGAGHYWVAVPERDFDIRRVGRLPGVRDVHRISDKWKLVSKKWKAGPSPVDVSGFAVGGGDLALMAGPCSVESEAQMRELAAQFERDGIAFMRGGVFKPRSSPYAFQGMGMEGLRMFREVCDAHGLRIVTEVMQADLIEPMLPYVDCFQVGARNSQNFDLLRALGESGKPVLLKRGISGTVEELLFSAEYIFSRGNERILLCERGIRSFETATRNTLDLNAVPWLKARSHLPVIVDPSHGTGIRELVEPLALAAVMAGADGLIYEVHPQPSQALSDGPQSLYPDDASRLAKRARQAFGLRKSF